MSELVVVEGQADYVPSFAIQLDEAEKRLTQFKAFVHKQMIKGEDYGDIEGISRPTLLKPGAEKLCNIFGFAPRFEEMRAKEDWEGGFFYYAYKCSLQNKRSGQIEAECEASCNSMEKKYRWRWVGKGQDRKRVENDDPYSLVNTLQKMAQKRALVGAVLIATRASGFFTQDMEDIGAPAKNSKRAKASKRARSPKGKKSDDPTTAYWEYVKAMQIDKAVADDTLQAGGGDFGAALKALRTEFEEPRAAKE